MYFIIETMKQLVKTKILVNIVLLFNKFLKHFRQPLMAMHGPSHFDADRTSTA